MNFRLTQRKGENYIVVDMANVTTKEMEIVNTYIAQGYKVAEKKIKGTSKKKGVTKEQIKTYAEENKNDKLLKMIKDKENYMKLLSAYNKTIENTKKK